MWQEKAGSITSTIAAAGWSWCLSVVNSSIMAHLARPSSLVVLMLVCEVGCDGWCAVQRHPDTQVSVAYLASGVGQLGLHVENGLLEILLLVCGSTTPAPSCQDERLQQTSRAAAAPQLACTQAPSMALTPALANSFTRFLTTPAPTLASVTLNPEVREFITYDTQPITNTFLRESGGYKLHRLPLLPRCTSTLEKEADRSLVHALWPALGAVTVRSSCITCGGSGGMYSRSPFWPRKVLYRCARAPFTICSGSESTW